MLLHSSPIKYGDGLMGKRSWHKKVEQALEKVGKDWRYQILRPRVIHFIYHGYAQFEYHPDVCWLYRGRNTEEPNAIIWEIESGYPDFKRICGDLLLAAKVMSKHAECYPWKDESGFGARLTEDRIYELGKKITYKKDERLLVRPNVKALFIIVENYEGDFQRYINTISKTMGLIEDATVFSVPRGLKLSEVETRIRRLKHLRERYK
jgi:hypothetical protein